MSLPVTVPSSDGLSVEGASPALLAELLGRYGDILQAVSPDVWLASRPGSPEDHIQETLARVGVAAHPELLVWWAWRNGFTERAGRGAFLPQLSISDACDLFDEISLLDAPMLRPEGVWLPVSGWDARHLVAFSASSTTDRPVVRLISPEVEPSQYQLTHGQTVSLCTYVTWHLDGIETGRIYFDSTAKAWKEDVDAWQSVPLELRLTGLV